MPDLRERLIKFIMNAVGGCSRYWAGVIADGLMENGVTDNNDGRKWIPVTERLPDHFGVFVVAISEPGKMRVGKDCADFDPFAKTWLPSMCWDRGYKVSHWMPLPEPPKEE